MGLSHPKRKINEKQLKGLSATATKTKQKKNGKTNKKGVLYAEVMKYREKNERICEKVQVF